jgi:hypothetical protein
MPYEDYLPSAPKYEFNGVEHYQQILDQQGDDQGEGVFYLDKYVIFTMDERCFLDYFLDPEERPLEGWLSYDPKHWESYDPSVNQLLVRLSSGVHGTATARFTSIFYDWIRTGTEDDKYPVDAIGRSEVRGTSGKTKRPDCSWLPTHSGLSMEYPSIAVEVAWSSTREKVEDDMRFWLTETEGQVNVALSITVYERGRIAVEEWGLKGTHVVPVQKIEIVQKPAPNRRKVEGHLSLDFEKIHKRPKQRSETDFVLTPDYMEKMAESIWRFQFAPH